MTPVEQIKEEILRMEAALLSSHPSMPVLLRKIHTQLKADPEIVTLLAEEDINKVVSGLMKQTQVEIASLVLKSKKVTTKITADNMGSLL